MLRKIKKKLRNLLEKLKVVMQENAYKATLKLKNWLAEI